MTPKTSAVFAALLVCAACGAPSESDSENLSEDSQQLTLGSGSVFAKIPNPPGYPEGIVVVKDKVYVSGPARLGTAGAPASKVLIYDRVTGAAAGSITLQGELLSQEHALSCITADSQDRLYVLSTQLGVVRLTKVGSTWQQSVYAPLPANLPVCAPGTPAPCSPTIYDGPPLVNDLAFDVFGNLYVTDSFQATIWKVAPGGGTPTIFFQNQALAAPPFTIGVNGIRVGLSQSRIYFTVSSSLANPAVGYVYSIPRLNPTAAGLQVFHTYSAGEGPDGIAFGLNNKLYATLAGANALSVLNASTGAETARYTSVPGSTIQYDAPANIAFDRRGNALITNHVIVSNNPANMAVLRVYVDNFGLSLCTP